MQLLVYLLTYPILRLVSLLPFPILYLVSDFVYSLVYRVFGYRKKVVRSNLELVFPEKSTAELRYIERIFYGHMCDMFLEMIKTMSISVAEIQKRYVFTNVDEFLQFEKNGQSVMLMLPHYASWEWVFSLNTEVSASAYGIYQPLTNKYFDRLVRSIRAKWGTTLITTKEIWDIAEKNNKEGKLGIYGIISDQSPMIKKAHYWAPFMGITVPMHTGAEYLCKKFDFSVVYMKVEKVKRGYYKSTFHVLATNPNEHPDYKLTDAFFEQVEKSIYEAPEYYFWTHKRWKHRDKVPEEFQET
ncbi:lysophospholipid acyltransferase family protein [Flavobacteriaceae bacterium D16]|nr:lysophospholipid acyltransferase family protein [Flavobacteriaceae bacterium D16]